MKAIALGSFDGLHAGHMAVLGRALEISAEVSVVCFEPIPRQAGGQPGPLRLTTPGERRKILCRSGIDSILVVPFDDVTRMYGPVEFLDMLAVSCSFEHVVVGYDFGFGSGRSGTPETLREWCSAHSRGLDVVEAVTSGGEPVKSERIRNLLAEGLIGEAGRLLGRRYSALGAVGRGRGEGRRLGFPTLNVHVPAVKLLPPPGSYSAAVALGGSVHPAAAFVPASVRGLVEAHLPGWSGVAYGDTAQVEFLGFLRKPESGLGRDELSGRIARDVGRVMEEAGI